MNTFKAVTHTTLLYGLLLLPVAALALEPATGINSRTILKTRTSWDGTPLHYPAGQAEVTGMLVEIAPHAETDWHQHPVPSFGLILQGELDVVLKNGQIKQLKAGDAIAEVVNTLHNGRNNGDIPVKLVVFYTGVAEQPQLTLRPPASGVPQ